MSWQVNTRDEKVETIGLHIRRIVDLPGSGEGWEKVQQVGPVHEKLSLNITIFGGVGFNEI